LCFEMLCLVEIDFGKMLKSAAALIPRRSLIFVVSDFISVPGWAAPLAHLAQRHDLVAVRLFDPLEMDLPDLGIIAIEDAETGEQLVIDTHDRGFRQRFREQAEAREQDLLGAFQDAGVDALELSTEDDLVDAIMRFADLRNWRAHLRSGGSLPKHLEGSRP